MKRTIKYTLAAMKLRDLGEKVPSRIENEELYEKLQERGFWWNGKEQAWEHEDMRPSTSIFSEKDGTATGIANIRLMCHPDETADFLKAIEKFGFWKVIEVSEKSYANRNGAGERTYIQVKRK